jgi:hypothetical protein
MNFNASEWVNLSPGERIKRCRIWAYEASELGRSAKSIEMKRMYLELSQNWQKLAGLIEREGSPGRAAQ